MNDRMRFATSGAAVLGFLAIGALAAKPAVSAPPVLPVVPVLSVVPVVPAAQESAVFAGGCFWGIEAVFEHVKGVRISESGYAGGTVSSPSYEQVSSGESGHAEVVRVVFDPAVVTYAQLMQVFFSVAHDPTQLNRQGPDHGTQYRSAIFYTSEAQKRAAESYIAQMTGAKTFSKPIVTQVAPLTRFWRAEGYHQDYMEHHPNQPYIVYNDAPKVEALRRNFPQLWRDAR